MDHDWFFSLRDGAAAPYPADPQLVRLREHGLLLVTDSAQEVHWTPVRYFGGAWVLLEIFRAVFRS